ncbi:MAG: M23 family metallopeptidase [Clostridia bacterium]|nr:M23 family metallopeptidase [Clostridia bacterium]
MKFNIPKMDKVKEGINNIKNKVKNKKENKVKIHTRYYGLLFLMILLGVVTVANNINVYNTLSKENYIEYKLPSDVQTEANNVEVAKYETAISSISTNVSNIKEDKTSDTIDNEEEKKLKRVWPVDGEIIREYAKDTLIYSKTLGMWLIHTGIDIKSELGENVKCIADGKVISIESNNFYGNVVRIEHEDGYISVYSNLAEDNLPKVNQKINKGEIIGTIGDTAYGESEEESHLHFEIIKDGTNINPEEFLNNQ